MRRFQFQISTSARASAARLFEDQFRRPDRPMLAAQIIIMLNGKLNDPDSVARTGQKARARRK